MKKLITSILLILVLVASFAFSACGDPFDDDNLGEDEVKGKVTLRLAALGKDSEIAVASALKKAFEAKYPKINIKIVAMNSDFQKTMTDYIKTPNTFPDIVWVPGEYHSPFSSAGHFIDLSDNFNEDFGIDVDAGEYGDFYQSVFDTTHFSMEDKGIWFAPRDYNKPVVVVNKTMLSLAGIEMPGNDWTMDDLFEICSKLRIKMDKDTANTKEEQGEGLRKQSYPIDANLSWNPSYMTLIDHYGGSLIDTSKTGAASLTMDSMASKEAYKEIYKNFVLKKYSPNAGTSDTFSRKYAAMWITVRPEVQSLINLGLDIDFLPLPTNNVAVGCSGYAISKQAQTRVNSEGGNTLTNAELAWNFINFVMSEEGQNVLGATGSGVPSRISMAEKGSWLSYYKTTVNHAAFVINSEKDMSQIDFYIYDPNNHLTIMKEFNALAQVISSPLTYQGTPLGGTSAGSGWKTFEEAIAQSKVKLLQLV